MTPAGHTPGLASSEPDTWVGIFLVSRLQNHDEGGTGYTGRNVLLVNSEEMNEIEFIQPICTPGDMLARGATSFQQHTECCPPGGCTVLLLLSSYFIHSNFAVSTSDYCGHFLQ